MIQKRTELDRYIIHWLSPCKTRGKHKKPKTNQNKNTKKQTTPTRHKNKNQHGWWSADQFMDNRKMHEEMITLYHLRDWYGNVKQKRNIRQQSAIQQTVSQEATNAQCGNQGSPQPGAPRSQSAAARASCSQIHGYDPKASKMLSCRI